MVALLPCLGSLGLPGLLGGCDRPSEEQIGEQPGEQGARDPRAGDRAAPGTVGEARGPGAPLDLESGAAPPGPDEWEPRHHQQVQRLCSSCHLAPPPDALPRAAWRDTIANMGSMPLPEGVDRLTPTEGRLALAHYERHAPVELALPVPPPGGGPLRFRTEHHTPPGLEAERIPAVTHVTFQPLHHPLAPDLLLTELRTSTAMVLPRWAPPEQRRLRPIRDRLDYPAQLTLADLDMDGEQDLVVAALGAINPTNEVLGGVLWAAGSSERRFAAPRRIGPQLARAAALWVGDLDADHDQDLVVAAFGLFGPGELIFGENLAGPGAPPRIRARILDPRDGFLAVVIDDVDADGRPDIIALLAQEHEELLVFLQREGGRFEPRVLYKAPHPGWGHAAMEGVDMDADGDLDLLVANGDTLDNHQLKPYHGVSWFERTGPLEYRRHRILELPGCERAAAGDLDGDGDLDVVAVSFLPQILPEVWSERGLASVVWVERLADGWQPYTLEQARNIHPAVAIGDADGDGDQDVAVGNYIWIDPETGPRLRADYLTLFLQEP